MPEGRSPTVKGRRFAAELRRLRDRAGLTGDQVAEQLGWSASKVSRIETGRIGASARDLAALLNLYGVESGRRDALLTLARQVRQKGWWDAYADTLPTEYASYIELEAEAAAIRCYGTQLVHGLLQTEDYARAVIRAALLYRPPGEVERRVEVRMARQALLRRDDPSRIWVILDEAVLHRRIGGPHVAGEQLRRLAELADQPHITLQVLPYTAGAHPSTAGEFSLLEFPEHADPDVVCIENMTSVLYVEDEAEVYSYALAFDHLAAMAAGPDDSRALIASAAEALS